MSRRKRRIITIGPERGKTGWWVANDPAWSPRRCRNKAELVRICRAVCRGHPPSQLRIKGRDGRLQTEHTYGADPRRHKG